MILVARPAVVPKALARGPALTAADSALRDAAPNEYEAGLRKFSFVKGVYGPKTVKYALAKAQHFKCCFCEGEFNAHVAGDVDHFRPKTSISTAAGRLYPGYYWLAYTLSNLYYACNDCNEYRKSNKFPLEHEAARARSHHAAIGSERALLLDPGGPSDPRDHIRFAADLPVGLTAAGRETIKVLRLDREPLNKRRRKIIARLEADRATIALWGHDNRPDAIKRLADARQGLAESVLPQAEFSATAQDFLSGWTPP